MDDPIALFENPSLLKDFRADFIQEQACKAGINICDLLPHSKVGFFQTVKKQKQLVIIRSILSFHLLQCIPVMGNMG